jgi:hypothetical protein
VRAIAKAGLLGSAAALAVWLLRRASTPAPAPAAFPEPAPAPSPDQAPAASETIVGYCVKERKKVAIKDPERTVSKDGRQAVRGTCPDCGAKIFRFV